MKYKHRICGSRLSRMVEHFSVVVVSGARQVGKSTLLKHQFPDWDTVVFDPVVDIANARRDPDLFLRNHPPPLILDEIQYCPEVVPCLKRLLDKNKRPGMYIMTGSQQWSVIKSINESLAGRAVFLDLEGFSLAEICQSQAPASWLQRYLDDPLDFLHGAHGRLPLKKTLYEQLWHGWLPETDQLPVDLIETFFAGYLRTYVERDVRLLLQVDDWQQFGRFVQMVAALTAQEINFSHLGREIGVTPQTAKRWLAALKATFQWHEVAAFHGNSIKRISLKPKGYFADTGLACHLARLSSPRALAGNPMVGALFETAVVADIRKQMTPMAGKAQLHHWRAHSGAEVDVVLERDGMLYPVEVKLTTRPSRQDTLGISSLRENYPRRKIAPGIVLAPVETIEQISENDYAVPWDLKIER